MKTPAFVLAALLVAAPSLAAAQAPDPALSPINTFENALLDVMKQAKALGPQGRYKTLLPAVEQAFDLPSMIRFAVGPAWSGFSTTERTDLTKAFGRLTAANLAHNFDNYSGQSFKVNPEVQTRGLDKLVRTQLVSRTGSPTDLNYRMRQSGADWKVIDIYYGAVSQLTAQRADFAATLTTGGAPALIQKLNAQSDKLLKGG